MMNDNNKASVIIIGAGFAGLSAALELTTSGHNVTVLEKEPEIGGLSNSFKANNNYQLEKFYHHCFNHDTYIMDLVQSLSLQENIITKPTKTGIHINNNFFRLSTPLDVLKFTPLNLIDRIRLGLLVLQVRKIKDWRKLESLTIKEWLVKLCGKKVYQTVWEPLIVGKFGIFADKVAAVWFWNKLVLRGGSRGKAGAEILCYYKNGFGALAEAMANKIIANGGKIVTGVEVESLLTENNYLCGVTTNRGAYQANVVIATPALPIIANIATNHLPSEYLTKLKRIKYLANTCLTLELSHQLSDYYWLNVNDTDFPFVGIIEHTNFISPENYGGNHIVYLSKYLTPDDKLHNMSPEETLNYALPYLKKMFPVFQRNWLKNYHVWRSNYAQPIAEKNYSQMIPTATTPLKNFYICTMAQIYPEDRGINYAIKQGQEISKLITNN
jgi:protoporphyrinogen oxidase